MARHDSDCAVHNGPESPTGECDCAVLVEKAKLAARKSKDGKLIKQLASALSSALKTIHSRALIDKVPG